MTCADLWAASEPALLTISRRNSVPGAVLTVGEGDTGQLGLGPDTMDCKRVKLVPQLEKDVIDVYAGGMHTLCLTADGKVSYRREGLNATDAREAVRDYAEVPAYPRDEWLCLVRGAVWAVVYTCT